MVSMTGCLAGIAEAGFWEAGFSGPEMAALAREIAIGVLGQCLDV